MKKTLLVTNAHQDYTGGGTHVMMMLNILKHYYDIYTTEGTQYYTHPSTPFHFSPNEIRIHSRDSYDVHLLAHYRGWVPPMGKTNVQILYYPVQKQIDGWNKLIVLNDFIKSAADKLYPSEIKTYIVPPYYNPENFYISEKTNSIINIGQYFIEQDGHSKNQHIILEWFKSQKSFEKIIFHGKLIHPHYYEYLFKNSLSDPRICLKHDATQEEIRKDLSESKYMLHAIGYGRTNPAQTEHFGLVAVEALLSGCQPIVHNSGGCKDIPGVITYNNFNELNFPEKTDPNAIREYGLYYTIQNTETKLMEAIND